MSWGKQLILIWNTHHVFKFQVTSYMNTMLSAYNITNNSLSFFERQRI